MFFHWVIRLLDILSVLFLGMLTLWLLCGSLVADMVRRSSTSKRAELFLKLFRNNTPFLKIPLVKSGYLIGRGPECDIQLKGPGIPLMAGELLIKEGTCTFINLHDNYALFNNLPIEKGDREFLSGDTIRLYNYSMTIQSV